MSVFKDEGYDSVSDVLMEAYIQIDTTILLKYLAKLRLPHLGGVRVIFPGHSMHAAHLLSVGGQAGAGVILLLTYQDYVYVEDFLAGRLFPP